ncbi:MAG: DegT/DnrJ/EryC1/StrS family aminotransferase [Euryarchaeota archaeon]|nr:DegT/DnrJ/EryC1/StrS family aminotransferase [Euryarchaeota archaeon]MDE1837253.1 DegT/DnrJ/EryC1/StrS family aminotransferase [Euryarchaeota archaeon]MDE1879923.1 DegT/DnrJ/EryC1/StrS family aminotransferase [Euryarchaeota archaeon]MDE2045143.1 DegT/DnrJ/EryC1/StrS family aminotransferase [Thermoplasmata archaeon]
MSAGMIPIAEPDLKGNEERYLLECLRSGWISSQGKFVTNFEKGFAEYIGTKHAAALSSGTAALHLALAAVGVGAGDEVILPTLTMLACANVVHYLGATPVLADSEEETWNLDPDDLERKITPRTKAIMVVHLYGHPAKMDRIMEVAERHHLPVVEDCAESHGAKVHTRMTGSIGTIGAFSLYSNKIITTGEGGMVTTNDATLDQKMKWMRNQCYDPPKRKLLIHNGIGYNYRMTSLQAAVGLAQLERSEELVAHHRKVAQEYDRLLAPVPGITRPPELPWARNVYWMYTPRIDAAKFGMTRDAVVESLGKQQIDSRSSFRPIHLQPPYPSLGGPGSFPVAERLGEEGINLPSGNVTTLDHVHRVVNALVEMRKSLA